jgi:probable F420-dependent oxidoreductase
MKLGCQMAFNERTSPDFIAAAGALVEECGIHSLWVPEHVLFFPEYASRYPYTENGKIAGDPNSLLEPLTALTWIAGHTTTLRLGTGILLVPQRNPVYTAKQVASLDYLSNGRVDFGIGIGWLKEEFEALGVPWEDRAGRTRECVELMVNLWCEDISSYQGQYFQLEPAYQNPKPVQTPHPPLFFGGESLPALRRVATQGQGWFGFNMSPDALAGHLESLQQELEKVGRSRDDILVNIAPAYEHMTQESLKAFAALGVDQVLMPLLASNEEKLRERTQKALDLMPG